MAERQIQVYGAPWCPDCKRVKQFLNEQRVPFEWIDVQENPDSMRYVEKINNGKQAIPTILFPDKSILVEPSNAELAEKLGLRPKAERTFYDLIIVVADRRVWPPPYIPRVKALTPLLSNEVALAARQQ